MIYPPTPMYSQLPLPAVRRRRRHTPTYVPNPLSSLPTLPSPPLHTYKPKLHGRGRARPLPARRPANIMDRDFSPQLLLRLPLRTNVAGGQAVIVSLLLAKHSKGGELGITIFVRATDNLDQTVLKGCERLRDQPSSDQTGMSWMTKSAQSGPN
jgi:hypothetical protein